jgi:hypothetical protein
MYFEVKKLLCHRNKLGLVTKRRQDWHVAIFGAYPQLALQTEFQNIAHSSTGESVHLQPTSVL